MNATPASTPTVPRRGVLWMVIAQATASFLALPGPTILVALALGGMPGAWMLFREGGKFAWLTAFVFVLTAIALGVLGGFFVAGKKVPGSVLYATALAPFLVGAAGAVANLRLVMSALGGASIDAAQGARIFAEGCSEAESTIVLGATMSALAMLLVGLASLFRVLSLDASALDPSGARRSLVPVAGTAGAMVFALVIAIAARVVVHDAGYPLSLLVLVGSLGVGVLAAWRAPLAAIVDGEDANTFRTLVLLALASASSVLLASMAGHAIAKARALGAISGESVDPSQKARILGEALAQMRAARLLGVIDGVLLLIGLGVPAITSGGLRAGLRPRAALAAWAPMLLLLVFAGAAQARLVKKNAAAFERQEPALAVAGLEVPTTRESWDAAYASSLLYVTRDGKLLQGVAAKGAAPIPATESSLGPFVAAAASRRGGFGDEARAASVGLVADRNVTYGALKTALAPTSKSVSRFALAITPVPEMRANRSALGDLAVFVGDEGMVAQLRFYAPTPEALGAAIDSEEPKITVVVDGPSAMIFRRRLPGSVVIPMGSGGAALDARRKVFKDLELTELGIAPKDDDTLDSIWALVEDARASSREKLSVVLSTDRRTLPERDAALASNGFGNGIGHGFGGQTASSSTASIRMGAVQVNGRLPPEIISRIVRQNFGRLRLCYENGLRTNPKLAGRVTVKFVIDRTGAVASAADGGSDLPDTSVVSCVVRGFSNLSFPQPEGGIVTVVYPIVFAAVK